MICLFRQNSLHGKLLCVTCHPLANETQRQTNTSRLLYHFWRSNVNIYIKYLNISQNRHNLVCTVGIAVRKSTHKVFKDGFSYIHHRIFLKYPHAFCAEPWISSENTVFGRKTRPTTQNAHQLTYIAHQSTQNGCCGAVSV